MKKEPTKKLLTIQLVIYWILLISKKYKLIAIDLSKQTKLKDPQQINFIGQLLKNIRAAIFLFLKNHEKQHLNIHKILSQSYK